MRRFKKKEKRSCECTYCLRREREALRLNNILKELSCDLRIDIYRALEDSASQKISDFIGGISDDGVSSDKFKQLAGVN